MVPVSGRMHNPDGTTREGVGTFSHPDGADNRCGGFEGGGTAEGFVRDGGVCLGHVRHRDNTVDPRYLSLGWSTYDEIAGLASSEPSFVFGYGDCPAVVVAEIVSPKDDGDGTCVGVRDGLSSPLPGLAVPHG